MTTLPDASTECIIVTPSELAALKAIPWHEADFRPADEMLAAVKQILGPERWAVAMENQRLGRSSDLIVDWSKR